MKEESRKEKRNVHGIDAARLLCPAPRLWFSHQFLSLVSCDELVVERTCRIWNIYHLTNQDMSLRSTGLLSRASILIFLDL